MTSLGSPVAQGDFVVPGGYRVKTDKFLCGCVETTIYTPDDHIYRKASIPCCKHGGDLELRGPLEGQMNLFTGQAEPKRRKKK